MTPNLGLPVLVEGQAGAELSVNEMMIYMDMLVQCAVEDKDLTTPPGSPTDGARYLLNSTPTTGNAWTGKVGYIAGFYNGKWYFVAPKEGMRVRVKDENQSYVRGDSSWAVATATA